MKYPPTTATIDPLFLSKVDRVFDASPRTVFNELLQNSRRAGAKSVFVMFAQDDDGSIQVTFTDDGKGISDPSVLLRLACRGWDIQTAVTEDPAGMGFFCLSAFGHVTVASNDWMASLTPATFRGEEPMRPQDCEFNKGTTIAWSWPGSGFTADGLAKNFERAAKHCDIQDVSYSTEPGGEVTAVEVTKFLGGADEIYDFPGFGYKIGIDEDDDGYKAGRYSRVFADLNFHGVEVEIELTNESKFFQAAAGEFQVRSVKVDIERTEDLQLVLPARNALKHNQARKQLIDHCYHVFLRWIVKNKQGQHGLSYAHYKAALELGYDIGEAHPSKLKLVGEGCGFRKGNKRVLWDMSEGVGDAEHLWVRGSEEYSMAKNWVLCRPCPKFEGYSWYDALPKVTRAFVDIGGMVVNCEEFVSDDWDHGNQGLFAWASSLSVHFKLSNGKTFDYSPEMLISKQPQGCCFDSAFYSGDDVVIYVREDIREDSGWLGNAVDLLTAHGFNASDDYESDSADTQENEFRTEASAALLEFIASPEEAVQSLLEDFLARHLPWTTRSHSWVITHEANDGTGPKIHVSKPKAK